LASSNDAATGTAAVMASASAAAMAYVIFRLKTMALPLFHVLVIRDGPSLSPAA
jgi:hypothetical protein